VEDDGTPGVLSSVSANGSATVTTTALTLGFTKAVTITAADIELGGDAAANVTKETISGSGTKTVTLNVTVTGGGTLTVKVGTVQKSVTLNWVDPYKDYYLKFSCTYDKAKQITEFIDIKKDKITFTDNEKSKANSTAIDDYIVFTVTKWETASVPTMTGYTGNGSSGLTYTKGFKITGKITAAQPSNTSTVYGPSTCPGITSSDVGTTELYIYFYFTDDPDPDDRYLARSAFFKTPTQSPAPMNPLSGTQIREYRLFDE